MTVDLSNTYLDWAQRNMARNGFQGPDHEFVRDDAMHFLQGRGRQAAFDLAVVDAPTFSNSKSLEDYWDIQRNHVELLNRLVELMAPGGIIFFSTNFRRFKLAEAEIRGVTIREISRQTVPADFRNRRIHRCWRMTRETSDRFLTCRMSDRFLICRFNLIRKGSLIHHETLRYPIRFVRGNRRGPL